MLKLLNELDELLDRSLNDVFDAIFKSFSTPLPANVTLFSTKNLVLLSKSLIPHPPWDRDVIYGHTLRGDMLFS